MVGVGDFTFCGVEGSSIVPKPLSTSFAYKDHWSRGTRLDGSTVGPLIRHLLRKELSFLHSGLF